MVLKVKNIPEVENLGHVPSEVAGRLRALLANGVEAQPDARRKGFYEVDGGTHTYWIHISPVSGRLMLMAAWEKLTKKLAPGNGLLPQAIRAA